MTERRLEQRPLGARIADHLRQDILLGRLRPGEAIAQDRLCAQYGTSRMPVRDALRTLASEGLVVNTQSRRSVVAQFTVADIEDSFTVEGLAHGRAARRATRDASDEDLEALVPIHEAMVAAFNEGAHDRIPDLNWRFHRQINLLAASPKLIAILRAVSLSIPRDYLAAMPPELADRSNRDHERILSAMRRRDEAEADYLVRMHVEEAGKNLVAYFIDSGLLREDPDRGVELVEAS